MKGNYLWGRGSFLIRKKFKRLQIEFETKGFLLLIKQSDKNTFSSKYKVFTKLKELNSDRLYECEITDSARCDFY